jgi:hypothetical protein
VCDLPLQVVLIVYIFSSQIEIPAGNTLAGNGSEKDKKTIKSGFLEVHGIGNANKKLWELCSVDALYPGALADIVNRDGYQNIIIATHTHFAPMLDKGKPALGNYSPEALKLYERAITSAIRKEVFPDKCSLFSCEVSIPVYRRYDYPKTFINKLLTRFAGLYPNDEFPIDKNIYIFLFSNASENLFALVYHACHPVTRADGVKASADYIEAIRLAVKKRFDVQVCLFMLGCAGDIRPNIAEKRVQFLPRCRINWKFKSPPAVIDEKMVDDLYRRAVLGGREIDSLIFSEKDFSIHQKLIRVDGIGALEIDELKIGPRFTFIFLPFEVSHIYHLDIFNRNNMPQKLIVSCAGNTKGYLPHSTQIPYGGYEVDGSIPFTEVFGRACIRGELP